jgi:adenylate cyclase
MSAQVKLSDISSCFQGVVPSLIATVDGRGVPNITYVSQVYYLDERHVALSCQFFNKTRRNLDENPRACVEMLDPLTLQAYRIRLRFLRSEHEGPLFDTMSARIEAIASATGMKGIFRLIAADVFEVQSLERVEGFLVSGRPEVPSEAPTLAGHRSEVRGLQWVSSRINRACDLEGLLHAALEALEEYFTFRHTSVLLYDEPCGKLVTLASRGYGDSGIGAEVRLGEGVIGTAARDRQVLRFSSFDTDLAYGRAIRREAASDHDCPDIPLPGLTDARSALAIPLTVGDRLVGVLSAEDRDPMRFGEWHEAYLQIIGNQIALGIERMMEVDAVAAPPRPEPGVRGEGGGKREEGRGKTDGKTTRTLTYYKKDDAIFVDGEYLIRNIPARILWKLLEESQRTGRTEFTNREVRLDEALGLPPVKDNFESRLILLRHRLQEKCPDVQIVPTGRGRFALQTGAKIEMIEK